MNFGLIRNNIRRASFFVPFRFQIILLTIVLFAAYYWLKKTSVLPETSYTAIIDLFITVAIAKVDIHAVNFYILNAMIKFCSAKVSVVTAFFYILVCRNNTSHIK